MTRYTSSPVHRFYQMWQQTDCARRHATKSNPSGCLNDLFPYTETTVGTGGNGEPQPAGFTDETTGEGSTPMGFWNMATGDVPYFKSLADQYTLLRQLPPVVHGWHRRQPYRLGPRRRNLLHERCRHDRNTTVRARSKTRTHSPGPTTSGHRTATRAAATPNAPTETQPGVAQVEAYLAALPYAPSPRCKKGAYYLVNNYNPGYYGNGTVNTSPFTVPPSSVPTIGDTLNKAKISWVYYGAGWNNYVANPNSELGSLYCNICNPFLYESSIMTSAIQRATHLKDVPDLYTAISNGTLPAVSIVKPDGLLDGHPASSKLDLFEAFTKGIIDAVQANKALWGETAILITEDEGGGYWDSGYIQPLDFFGDGTRMNTLMVSPFATGGHVNHTYTDHVSFLKFVEKNWHLPPVTKNSRDNLPNPIVTASNPYVPLNSPAIGDLMDVFAFPKK